MKTADKTLGTDSTGTWTPHQYAIDLGWGYFNIEETAAKGLAETDAEGLSSEQQSRLLQWCKDQQQYKKGFNAGYALGARPLLRAAYDLLPKEYIRGYLAGYKQSGAEADEAFQQQYSLDG